MLVTLKMCAPLVKFSILSDHISANKIVVAQQLIGTAMQAAQQTTDTINITRTDVKKNGFRNRPSGSHANIVAA
jgi:hypothetical protein